ncbi:MAG TPA: hypothetical protein VL463_11890 [Kofleriaceae bacterium]|jgi:hypothetical protein|nr:hypothetical protein [Kofleriaceae bacterium]
MKKLSKKSIALTTETIRPLNELASVTGGQWTTRKSDGLPCTNEPTSTNTCPVVTKK